MLDHIFSLPGPVALVAALMLLGVAFFSLKGNKQFGILFILLVLCRAGICAQFHLLFSGGGLFASVFGALADFVFLAPLLFMAPGRKRRVLFIGLSLLVLTANLADTGYSLESGFRLQYMFVENLDVTAMLIRWEYTALAVAGLLGLTYGLHWLFVRLKPGTTPRNAAVCILVLSLAAFLGNVAESPSLRLLSNAVHNAQPKAMLGVVADSAVRNFFVDALRPPPNFFLDQQDYTEAEQIFLKEAGLTGPVQRSNAHAMPSYDRVVCVFLESVSKSFVMGPEALRLDAATAQTESPGLPVSSMPFLASLLDNEHALAVTNYHSSAFSTNDAIYAALASRPDFGGDVLRGRTCETLFSLALARGYQTAFFLGSSGTFGRLSSNYTRFLKVETIFDKHADFGLPPEEKPSQWGDTDARVFEKALIWMRNNAGSRYLVGISTIDMHPPFYAEGPPPAGFKDTPLTRALFSTDTALASFVTALKHEGLLDPRTLLVITADHQITHGGKVALEALPGEHFGDRLLPLVFVSGNLEPLRNITDPPLCSAVDLAPTLGDLLGFPPQPSYYGKSLFLDGGHYDLALSRDGILYFGLPHQEEHSFNLDMPAQEECEKTIRKWYFNTQQGYRETGTNP